MNRIIDFFSEVKSEIGKVIWPRKEEFIGSVMVVGILIFFAAIILGGMDFGYTLAIKSILR